MHINSNLPDCVAILIQVMVVVGGQKSWSKKKDNLNFFFFTAVIHEQRLSHWRCAKILGDCVMIYEFSRRLANSEHILTATKSL